MPITLDTVATTAADRELADFIIDNAPAIAADPVRASAVMQNLYLGLGAYNHLVEGDEVPPDADLSDADRSRLIEAQDMLEAAVSTAA